MPTEKVLVFFPTRRSAKNFDGGTKMTFFPTINVAVGIQTARRDKIELIFALPTEGTKYDSLTTSRNKTKPPHTAQ